MKRKSKNSWYGFFRFFKPVITKRTLTDQDRSRLNKRVKESEKRTRAQIVLAVIDRCDVYAELPWKAFALGASIAGLTMLAVDTLHPVWVSGTTILFAVVVILAAGAASALLCVFIPGFARFFLDKERAEVEVRQYAQSLFLSRELFSTKQRTGILLLVGLFERLVVILPDTGVRKQLDQAALKKIICQMTKSLSLGQIAGALEEGLQGLEQVLSDSKPSSSRRNELPDEVIEEEGR